MKLLVNNQLIMEAKEQIENVKIMDLIRRAASNVARIELRIEDSEFDQDHYRGRITEIVNSPDFLDGGYEDLQNYFTLSVIHEVPFILEIVK